MNDVRCQWMFNVRTKGKRTGFSGNVYGIDGLSRTLNTVGGGNTQPLIIVSDEQQNNNMREAKHKRVAQQGL